MEFFKIVTKRNGLEVKVGRKFAGHLTEDEQKRMDDILYQAYAIWGEAKHRINDELPY